MAGTRRQSPTLGMTIAPGKTGRSDATTVIWIIEEWSIRGGAVG